ncbi:MAG: hypothetical protein ABI670_08875 [Chloroflexota bacterium]
MPKKTLIWISDDPDDAEEPLFLDYSDDRVEPKESFKLATCEKTTLEQIADMCDRSAESRNVHMAVGACRLPAALLYRKLDRATASELLLEIAQYGSIDGMNGLDVQPDAFAELGIADAWNEWSLPA